MPSTTHTINVGGGGSFMYKPDTVYANVGDLVVFKFYPTNHSVVRGEYTQSAACGDSGCNPCVPYELIHPDQEGFHSGNVLTQNSAGSDRTFNITIKNTSPIWFYCTALQSCHPNGMVGVINPANGTSIDRQKQAAISAPFQLLPGEASGEAWSAEGVNIGSETVPVSASPSTSPAELKHHLSSGAIAGIAIVVTILVGIAAALSYFIGRPKKGVTKYATVESSSNRNLRTIGPVANAIPPKSVPNMWNPTSPVSMNQYLPLSEKPSLSPPPGHPAFGPFSEQSTTYELEGEINQLR